MTDKSDKPDRTDEDSRHTPPSTPSYPSSPETMDSGPNATTSFQSSENIVLSHHTKARDDIQSTWDRNRTQYEAAQDQLITLYRHHQEALKLCRKPNSHRHTSDTVRDKHTTENPTHNTHTPNTKRDSQQRDCASTKWTHHPDRTEPNHSTERAPSTPPPDGKDIRTHSKRTHHDTQEEPEDADRQAPSTRQTGTTRHPLQQRRHTTHHAGDSNYSDIYYNSQLDPPIYTTNDKHIQQCLREIKHLGRLLRYQQLPGERLYDTDREIHKIMRECERTGEPAEDALNCYISRQHIAIIEQWELREQDQPRLAGTIQTNSLNEWKPNSAGPVMKTSSTPAPPRNTRSNITSHPPHNPTPAKRPRTANSTSSTKAAGHDARGRSNDVRHTIVDLVDGGSDVTYSAPQQSTRPTTTTSTATTPVTTHGITETQATRANPRLAGVTPYLHLLQPTPVDVASTRAVLPTPLPTDMTPEHTYCHGEPPPTEHFYRGCTTAAQEDSNSHVDAYTRSRAHQDGQLDPAAFSTDSNGRTTGNTVLLHLMADKGFTKEEALAYVERINTPARSTPAPRARLFEPGPTPALDANMNDIEYSPARRNCRSMTPARNSSETLRTRPQQADNRPPRLLLPGDATSCRLTATTLAISEVTSRERRRVPMVATDPIQPITEDDETECTTRKPDFQLHWDSDSEELLFWLASWVTNHFPSTKGKSTTDTVHKQRYLLQALLDCWALLRQTIRSEHDQVARFVTQILFHGNMSHQAINHIQACLQHEDSGFNEPISPSDMAPILHALLDAFPENLQRLEPPIQHQWLLQQFITDRPQHRIRYGDIVHLRPAHGPTIVLANQSIQSQASIDAHMTLLRSGAPTPADDNALDIPSDEEAAHEDNIAQATALATMIPAQAFPAYVTQQPPPPEPDPATTNASQASTDNPTTHEEDDTNQQRPMDTSEHDIHIGLILTPTLRPHLPNPGTSWSTIDSPKQATRSDSAHRTDITPVADIDFSDLHKQLAEQHWLYGHTHTPLEAHIHPQPPQHIRYLQHRTPHQNQVDTPQPRALDTFRGPLQRPEERAQLRATLNAGYITHGATRRREQPRQPTPPSERHPREIHARTRTTPSRQSAPPFPTGDTLSEHVGPARI